MTTILSKIKQRGYWEIIIRPNVFNPEKIQYDNLLQIIQKSSVKLRGWDFPHINNNQDSIRQANWVGQESEFHELIESWRLYQSGQFIDIKAIRDDWRDQSSWSPAYTDWKQLQDMSIGNTLFTFTEIFEFAARLSLTEAGDDTMVVDISLHKLQGRELFMDDPTRMWFGESKTDMPTFSYKKVITREELISQTRELALQAAIEFFQRFGWSPTLEQLRDWQNQLRR